MELQHGSFWLNKKIPQERLRDFPFLVSALAAAVAGTSATLAATRATATVTTTGTAPFITITAAAKAAFFFRTGQVYF
jgi:hypothetical protein